MTSLRFGPLRRLRRWLAITLVALLAACAGGDGDGVGTGGTGSFTLGKISGFGSIIVNDIRYEDDSALVFDASGNPSNRGALRRGMVVEVEGSALTVVDGESRGRASTIRFGSEVLGPVSAIGSDSMVVLGQTVRVGSGTVFETVSGLSLLRIGDLVEVYGFAGADGGTAYIATRVDAVRGASEFALRGTVSDVRPAERTLRVNGLLVDASSSAELPTAGQLIRVRLGTVPRAADGAYPLAGLRDAARPLEDRAQVRVDGLITAFTSPTRFSVDGIPVDAGGATRPPSFPADPRGLRVEVSGRLAGGTLIADQVSIERDDDPLDGNRRDTTPAPDAPPAPTGPTAISPVAITAGGTPPAAAAGSGGGASTPATPAPPAPPAPPPPPPADDDDDDVSRPGAPPAPGAATDDDDDDDRPRPAPPVAPPPAPSGGAPTPPAGGDDDDDRDDDDNDD